MPGVDRLEMMLEETRMFSNSADLVRTRDVDILDPGLVAAIDDFRQDVNLVHMLYQSMRAGSLRQTAAGDSLRGLVDATKTFARAYADVEGSSWLVIPQRMRDGYATYNETLTQADEVN